MGPIFDELGFSEMKDYALAAATGGIMGAIIVGMGLVNWAIRKGYVEKKSSPKFDAEDWTGIIPEAHRPSAGKLTVSSDVIESLSLHLVFVGAAILLGWLMKQGLLHLVQFLPEKGAKIFSSFPLFPLCMLGGVIVQWFADRFDPHEHMDHNLMLRIQNCALDFLVVAAIATIRIDVIAKGWIPLVILIFAGIAWNVLMLTVFARRAFKDAWFERGIAEMGQSMGVTATGLLLLRVVDPDYETEAAEAFAAKQLLHEPFMGGGLWTSTAIPLLALWGGWPILGIALGVMAIWTITLVLMGSPVSGSWTCCLRIPRMVCCRLSNRWRRLRFRHRDWVRFCLMQPCNSLANPCAPFNRRRKVLPRWGGWRVSFGGMNAYASSERQGHRSIQ